MLQMINFILCIKPHCKCSSLTVTIFYLTPDVLGSLLCGGQPLQVPAHLHRGHSEHVQGQKEARDAPSHLRHHRHCLQEHDAG